MKHLVFLLCLSLFFSMAFAQEDQKENEIKPPQKSETLMNYIQSPTKPEVYPLTLIDGNILKNLSLWDREIFSRTFLLKNISDKPAKIKSIVSSCSCLTIEKVENVELKPG